tara:strand:- start:1545 stop:1859 length:315 start_codon:yes stop_codon:yes gene_type:complete
MSVLNVDYTFKILSVDQEQSTMLVEFDPLDDDCLPVTLNCLLHLDSTDNHPSYANTESIPLVDHLKFAARICAPHATWSRQKYIALKASEISAQITANTFISSS